MQDSFLNFKKTRSDRMNYFIIKAKGASVFWTGTQWHHPAKRYKSRKIAENAIRKTTNHYEFSRREKEVIEINLP
jgi:hypothetical protein